MYTLTENDYKLIKRYKKFRDEETALYFFNRYKDQLIDVVFYKINKKFSSIPFEKGDLFHLAWNSVKKTLREFKENDNFNASLIRNCYLSTIDEVRKFVNNKELIMNISGSWDKVRDYSKYASSHTAVVNFSLSNDLILKDLINTVSGFISNYSQPTIKRVIYLKSLGYSVTYISKKLRLSRSHVESLLKSIERVVRRIYKY